MFVDYFYEIGFGKVINSILGFTAKEIVHAFCYQLEYLVWKFQYGNEALRDINASNFANT